MKGDSLKFSYWLYRSSIINFLFLFVLLTWASKWSHRKIFRLLTNFSLCSGILLIYSFYPSISSCEEDNQLSQWITHLIHQIYMSHISLIFSNKTHGNDDEWSCTIIDSKSSLFQGVILNVLYNNIPRWFYVIVTDYLSSWSYDSSVIKIKIKNSTSKKLEILI